MFKTAPKPSATRRSTLTSVHLSEDRRVLRLVYDDDHTIRLDSARANGFTDRDVEHARHALRERRGVQGQRNMAWQRIIHGWEATVQVHLGPPTWWVPQIGYDTPEWGTRRVRAGWLRALGAITVSRPRHGTIPTSTPEEA